jgi:hypothetical protein
MFLHIHIYTNIRWIDHDSLFNSEFFSPCSCFSCERVSLFQRRINIHEYTYIYTYINEYIHIYENEYIHIYIYIYTYMYDYMYIYE